MNTEDNNILVNDDNDDDDDIPDLVPIQYMHTTNVVHEQQQQERNDPSSVSQKPIEQQQQLQQSLLSVSSTTTTAATELLVPISPVPVTILSGCLGSGKSTFIQSILQQQNSKYNKKRFAIIENEYGSSSSSSNNNKSMSIESMIIRDGNTRMLPNNDNDENQLLNYIELPNGCICCTVKDSLVLALEQFIQRTTMTTTTSNTNNSNANNNNNNKIDHIIIECSGMVNPGPIASIFWYDDNPNDIISSSSPKTTTTTTTMIQQWLRLDGIITMVDAVHLEQQLLYDVSIETSQQIAYADRILLNKVDLLLLDNNTRSSNDRKTNTTTATDHTKIERCIQLIHSIHPTVPIRTTSYAIPLQQQQVDDDDDDDETTTNTNTTEPKPPICIVDDDWLFNIHGYTMESYQHSISKELQQQQQRTKKSTPIDFFHDMESCNPCSTSNSTTDLDIVTATMAIPQLPQQIHSSIAVTTITVSSYHIMDLHKVHVWLASILWPNQDAQEHTLRTQMEYDMKMTRNNNNDDNIDDDTIKKPNVQQQQHQQQQIFRIKGILSIGTTEKKPTDDNYSFLQQVMVPTRSIPTVRNDNEKEESLLLPFSNDNNQRLLSLYADQRRYIVQGVYDLWDIHPCTNPELFWNNHNNNNDDDNNNKNNSSSTVISINEKDRISELILIGRHLNRKALQMGFNKCKVEI